MNEGEVRAVKVETVEVRITLPGDDGYRVLSLHQARSLCDQLSVALYGVGAGEL